MQMKLLLGADLSFMDNIDQYHDEIAKYSPDWILLLLEYHTVFVRRFISTEFRSNTCYSILELLFRSFG